MKVNDQKFLDDEHARYCEELENERTRYHEIQPVVEQIKAEQKMRENQNYYQQLSQERNRKKYVYNPAPRTYNVPKKSPTRVPAPMQQPEHFVNEFQKNQVTEFEIERESDELFRTTPIPFRPRKGEVLDESIA
jgi:hypothetical protein